jgi:hypothetical protein
VSQSSAKQEHVVGQETEQSKTAYVNVGASGFRKENG